MHAHWCTAVTTSEGAMTSCSEPNYRQSTLSGIAASEQQKMKSQITFLWNRKLVTSVAQLVCSFIFGLLDLFFSLETNQNSWYVNIKKYISPATCISLKVRLWNNSKRAILWSIYCVDCWAGYTNTLEKKKKTVQPRQFSGVEICSLHNFCAFMAIKTASFFSW